MSASSKGKTRSAAVVAKPLARLWLRGPAWIEGDAVAMDCARATVYQPLAEPRIALELSRVRTAADAADFATRFGLLGGPKIDRALVDALLRHRGLPGYEGYELRIAREPVESFLRAAGDLRRITHTLIRVRRALNGGERGAEAMESLRARFNGSSDREILIGASEHAAWGINDGLLAASAAPYVFDRAQMGEPIEPGHWRIGVLPESLLGVCYLAMGLNLSDQEPLEECVECGRLFVVDDPRRHYCSPQCALRFRQRKFQAANRERTERETERKTKRNGKQTRKR